ncbi:MAG: peptidylprolyl isomerase [Bacteroidetes bacterium]|nr:peptidylprolyl isomerase [Bacteroidota bacterium]MBU1678836.1 peptidylprolyl isomerase [Bacteroidota bacterium]MBU2507799.1 peptidylprolyl isomerase [Bacteroidota bacterium]
MHSSHHHLNGRYSNFGFVVEGIEVVDNMEIGDKILEINLN